MTTELDDLFASPGDRGLSRSSVCSRTRMGSENRTTTSQQPTLLSGPCDRVAAKGGLFLGSVARNAALATDRRLWPFRRHWATARYLSPAEGSTTPGRCKSALSKIWGRFPGKSSARISFGQRLASFLRRASGSTRHLPSVTPFVPYVKLEEGSGVHRGADRDLARVTRLAVDAAESTRP
jgi:hypothetical protein